MSTAVLTVAVAAACLLGSVGLHAAERKIQKKDLPAAVQKALDAETKGGSVKGFAKETENGKVFYEMETVKDGRSRDVLFDPDGHVVEVEEEVPLESVPEAVKTALSAHGKVTKVEAVTKGSVTVYEGHVEKGGKKSEVKVSADGKPV
jgi:uncharacterized membrane protein YkoI